MALGDVYEATVGDATDVYYVDTALYGTPEFGSVYIVDAPRPALVDTGMGTNWEAIVDAMASLGIDPDDLAVIAPTHVHLDHAGGAGYLADACPNADVYVHERGAGHLEDPSRLWEGTKRAVGDQIEYYAEPRPIDADRIVELTDGDAVDLGDRELAVHHAPGHAPHQAIFDDPASDGVFAADAAGIYTPTIDRVQPTSPPPDFDLEQCLADVETIRDLDPAALYFGHFGAWPTGELLAEYETVLEEWVADVEAARAEFGDDEAAIAYLADRAAETVDWPERKARAEATMNARGVMRYLDGRESE